MPALNTRQWTTSLTTNNITSNMIGPSTFPAINTNSNSSISIGRQTIDEDAITDFYNAARLLKALMQRSKLTMIAPDVELEDRYRNLQSHFDNWLYAIATDRPIEECNVLADQYIKARDRYATYDALAQK